MKDFDMSHIESILKSYSEFLKVFSVNYEQLIMPSLLKIAETVEVANQQILLDSQQLVSILEFISEHRETLFGELSALSAPIDYSSILDGIRIHNDSVEISDESSEVLSSIIEYPQYKQQPVKKFSFEDFVVVILFPLILALLSMLQTSYYHHLDSLESQKQQLAESEYQERLLEIVSEHNENIKNLNDTLNNIEQYLSELPNNRSMTATDSTADPESAESKPEIDDVPDRNDTRS